MAEAAAPRNAAGAERAGKAGGRRGVAAEPEKKEEAQEPPRREAPHNAEAARMLDEARVFLKGGRKSDARRILNDLIAQYPDTAEAEQAKSLLELIRD